MRTRRKIGGDFSLGCRYAFVTFDNKDSAIDATEGLNGATILGQQVKVNVARPKNGNRQEYSL